MKNPEIKITKSQSEVNSLYDIITESYRSSKGNIIQLIYDEYEDSWAICKPDFNGHNKMSFYSNEDEARRNFNSCINF